MNVVKYSLVMAIAAMLQMESSVAAEVLTLKSAIERSLTLSPEIKASESRHNAAVTSERLGLSPFLPELALEAGHQMRRSSEQDISGAFVYGVGRINLYNGGRDLAERNILRSELKKAESEYQLAKAKIARNVARAYLSALYYQEAIRLKREWLKDNDGQRQIARRKASGGLTSDADVQEFEFRENDLNAQIALLEHERNLALRNLTTLLGMEPRIDIELKGSLGERPSDLDVFAADDLKGLSVV